MTLSDRPIRVLFLLQRPEAWGNVASIWRAMMGDPIFEPVIWLLPYNAEDMELSIIRLQSHREVLAAQGAQWVEWEPGLHLTPGQFDIAIFTHPYDRERPRSLWFGQVRTCVKKIVYVPYGLSVGAGIKNIRLQFAQPLQVGADLIVARSPTEKALYAQYCPAGGVRIQVLGHPRFDRLLEELRTIDTSGLKKRIGDRTAILWNSHFSFGHKFSQSSNFSSFDLLGPELLDYFAAHRTALCLLWRPHPWLFPELLRQGILTPEEIPVLRAELDGLGIVLDEQADHFPAFACSQALISDPGSFLFEYLATGKPLLPLMNPDGEPLNAEATRLVADCGSASHFAEVRRFIVEVIMGDIDEGYYRALGKKYLPLLDGNAARRVCMALLGQAEPDVEVNSSAFTPGRTPVYRTMSSQVPAAWVHAPPLLARLQADLRKIRAEKAAQSRFRKWSRRQANLLRVSVGELVKQKPWLMALTKHVRSGL